MPDLRTALVVDGHEPSGWARQVLEALRAACPVPVTVMTRPGAPTTAPPRPGRAARWLAGRVAASLDHPGAAATAAGAPEPVVVPWVPEGDPCRGADVVVDLTRDGVAAGAALAHWRFRFGADGGPDPVGAFVDAALAGRSTVDVRLERRSGTIAQPLREGTFRFDAWAPWAGAGAAASSFTAWPAWCAAALADDPGAATPFGATPAFAGDALPAPAGLDAARAAARAAAGLARRLLWAEVWAVGLSDERPEAVIAGERLGAVRWLPERGATGLAALWAHRGFAADPFLFRHGEQAVCLFEALDHGAERGWIAAVDVPAAPGPLVARDVFRNDWHWSYPFVLEDGGDTYCLPETADAGGVLLHRLGPGGFEQVGVLLEGLAVLDPTIVRHDGRYWLFCTLRDGPLLNTELHLFVADRLAGPYRPHRHNPVKIDARSARPAGSIVEVGGVLHRPGQDCGADYGAGLVLHRIDELSETAFREHPVVELRPRPPYPAGVHTLSVGAGWLAVDAKRYAFSPPMLMTRLAQVAARLRRR